MMTNKHEMLGDIDLAAFGWKDGQWVRGPDSLLEAELVRRYNLFPYALRVIEAAKEGCSIHCSADIHDSQWCDIGKALAAF